MKNRILTSVSALAVAAFFASAASATDLKGDPTSADYQEPKANWNGIWVGALGGYQFSNSEKSFNFDKFDSDGDRVRGFGGSTDGLGAEGLFGELQLGYDQQIGRFVVGAFGGLNLTDNEHIQSVSFFDGVDTESVTTLALEQEWGGVLGLRAGILKSQDTMFFVAGGWAFGEMGKLRGDGEELFEDQETDLSGWFAEIGMETRVHNNVYLTVAGRYTDYGSIDLASGTEDCGGATSRIPCDTRGHSLELDTDTLSIMAGLKFKLNGGLGF